MSITLAPLLLTVVPCAPTEPPQDFEALLSQAEQAAEDGRFERAAELLFTALELSPENPQAAYFIGHALLAEGQVDQAIEWLERAGEWGRAGDPRHDAALAPLYGEPAFDAYLERARVARLAKRRAQLGSAQQVRERRRRLDRAAATASENTDLPPDGHAGPVRGARFSPDGDRVLSWGDDGTVRLWDALTLEHVAVLGYHHPAQLTATFDATGERVLVLDRRAARAGLFDGQSGGFIAWLERAGELELVQTALFAPDGATVATAPVGGGVFFWDTLDGSAESELTLATKGRTRIQFQSVDGGDVLATLAADGRVRLFDPKSATLVGELPAGPTVARKILFVANGRRLVVRGDGVRMWVLRLDLESPERSVLTQLPPSAFQLREDLVDARGRWILSSGAEASVEIRDLASGELVRSLPHERACQRVGFSPAHARVVTFEFLDSYLRMWDAQSGEFLRDLGPMTRLSSWAWSPDGARLAVAEVLEHVQLFDGLTGEWLAALAGATGGTVHEIAFDPSGQRVVHGQHDASLGLWDLARPSAGQSLRGSSGESEAGAEPNPFGE
jgi:tetratricopeptide (TPR) repeat protein